MLDRMLCWAALLIAAAPAHAEWTGKAEAGVVFASGNTETETANAKVLLTSEIDEWKHRFGADALYSAGEEGRTAQRWQVFGQTDYSFQKRRFWFVGGRYEQDEFSGFEYQATASAGVGRKFIDSTRTSFTGAVGVGYKFFETRAALDASGAVIAPSESDREAVFSGALDFERQLTATTSLIDKFVVEAGDDNTFLRNDVSLQVKINSVLALALGYSVRHNTNPPTGFQETDTLTTVNLVYELK
jgi:putative salt-induced outer membrane protein